MKRLELFRTRTGDTGTLGNLVLAERGKVWHSLELPWRDNHRGHSCIPGWRGVARLRPSTKWSPRTDGRLYGLVDVPGRDNVLIHAATWAGDADLGWKAELLGCIAPGMRFGQLTPPDFTRPQDCVIESRKALTELMDLLAGDEEIELSVKWDAGVEPAVA